MTILRARPRSPKVTGRKLAGTPPNSVRQAYSLDPQSGVRSIVAALSTSSAREIAAIAEMLEALDDDRGEPARSADPQYAEDAANSHEASRKDLAALPVSAWRSCHGRTAPLIPINSLDPPGGPSYPLRRTHTVTTNVEDGRIVAEIREITDTIGVRGEGTTTADALDDLYLRLAQVIRTAVHKPPHAQTDEDRRLTRIFDHMIDWDAYYVTNPVEQPIIGRLEQADRDGRVVVYWEEGPRGEHQQTTTLRPRDAAALRHAIPCGQWFHAVVRVYPDRIGWAEPPEAIPDPHDPKAIEKAWRSIPVRRADEPGVWPLKGRE